MRAINHLKQSFLLFSAKTSLFIFCQPYFRLIPDSITRCYTYRVFYEIGKVWRMILDDFWTKVLSSFIKICKFSGMIRSAKPIEEIAAIGDFRTITTLFLTAAAQRLHILMLINHEIP